MLSGLFMTLINKALENMVGKGENAGNHHFLPFLLCYLTYQKKNSSSEPPLNCFLQIWTGLKFYCFGKSLKWNSTCMWSFNPLPDMPILVSFNLVANKDMTAKVWTNGDSVICLSRKHCGKRRNCSLRAISPFPTMFSKAVYC